MSLAIGCIMSFISSVPFRCCNVVVLSHSLGILLVGFTFGFLVFAIDLVGCSFVVGGFVGSMNRSTIETRLL